MPDVAKSARLDANRKCAKKGPLDPKRFVAGRLLWRLARLRDVSGAEKVNAKQSDASRKTSFGSLSRPEADPKVAAVAL